MRSILLCTLVMVVAAGAGTLRAQETASIPTADGFQCPVGPNGTGEGYYIARGYRPNGHLGDDWNGTKGGDTDYGDPVYATAHGVVVFARNYHVGWGNVVILRHAFYEGLTLKVIDSLYGHLRDFNVQEGQEVKRGQLLGHIGNNNGMYDAHLHFEMRKNINIGMYRGSFPRDDTNYYEPNRFLAAHLSCPHGGKTVSVPVNTYAEKAPPAYIADKVDTPMYSPFSAPASHLPPPGAGSSRIAREPPPEPKVVTAPPSTPKPAPPPSAPAIVTTIPKSPATPAPPAKASATASITSKASSTPAPSTKSSKTASTAGKTAATPSPASTGSATASKTPSTPSPSGKGTTTASAKATPKPSPSTKSSTVASAATPAPPPVAAKATAVVKASPTEAATPKPAKPEAKPSALAIDAYEPAAPAPTTGSPIRRSQPTFRVDRFQDLRGMGY